MTINSHAHRGQSNFRMSTILLRLFQSIKHRLWLVFLRNRLRESCIPIEHRYNSLSWAGLQVAPTAAERNKKLRNTILIKCVCK